MADILDRLRFDAARCEVDYSKGVATNIEEAADEIERLRAALDKIVGIALGRADFPAALVHRIAHDALGNEPKADGGDK